MPGIECSFILMSFGNGLPQRGEVNALHGEDERF